VVFALGQLPLEGAGSSEGGGVAMVTASVSYFLFFIIPQLAHPCPLPLIIVSGLWSSSSGLGVNGGSTPLLLGVNI